MKPEKLPVSKSPNEPTAFAVWGALVGAVLGALAAFVTRHWMSWMFGVAIAGWMIGAVLDRARRN